MGCGASTPATAADVSSARPAQSISPPATVATVGGSRALARRTSVDASGRVLQPGDRRSARRAAKRRGSAIASTIAAFTPLNVEKDAAQLAMIVEAIKARPVFGGLDEPVLLRAAKVMYERQVAAGTRIIEQGDTADHFYVLAEGKVQVLINGKAKRILLPGAGFGELGVLYGLPRSASCVAETAVRVWVLDRKPFKHIVVREQSNKRCAPTQKFFVLLPVTVHASDTRRFRLEQG